MKTQIETVPEHNTAGRSRMAQSLTINNYRCFKHLEVSALRRVNIVVGSNGSGKTALLEAIFMACGSSPELYLKTRLWRGLRANTNATSLREAYESLFTGMFHAFEADSPVLISLTDTRWGRRDLTVYFQRQETLSLPLRGDVIESSAVIPVVFRWKTPNGENESPVKIEGDELKIKASSDIVPGVFVSSSSQMMGKDTMERFSSLSKKKQLRPLIESIRSIFPEVEDITLETDGSGGGLYVSVSGIPEKMPLGMLSAGITKYVTILLAIAATTNGVVLVDEIENGFYYEALPLIMSKLYEACTRNGVQMFATTHSMEFLRSLYSVMQGKEHDFCLLRMERLAHTSTVERFSGEELRGAIEQRVEVR